MHRALSPSHDLWLPIVVGTLSGLISFTLWGMLVSARHEQIMASTREVAAEVEKTVSDRAHARYSSLVALASDYPEPITPEPVSAAPVTRAPSASDDPKAPTGTGGTGEAEAGPAAETKVGANAREISGGRAERIERLRERARSLAEEWTGLAQLTAVELGESPRTIPLAPAHLNQRPSLDAATIRTLVGERRAPRVAPIQDETGAWVQEIYVPVRGEGRTQAALVARVELQPFLSDLFRARALPYALQVSWQGTPVFQRGEPSTDPLQKWWRIESRIDHTLGPPWIVEYRPTPGFAAQRLDPTPHYLLFVGLVLSMSLAFLSHQLRKTVRQSRSLADKNRSLEERGQALERLNEALEQRVTERTRALEDAVSELEAFNYSVSHDLRSPLGAILNFAAVVEEDFADRPLGQEGMELVGRIKRSANRATSLLEDLLQLSRASRRDLQIERVDMTRVAKESYQQASTSEDTTEVDLQIGSLPCVPGDPHLLGNVFVNLLTNALKYSRGLEKRVISVSGHVEGNEAFFEVRDTGRGFDMRFASKLFQVFERLHNDDQIAGTGVGLAVVDRIVRRHGGRVWAHGEVDRGACFGFALPLGHGEDQ